MNDILLFDYKHELNNMIDDDFLLDSVETPITKTITKSFKRFYLESIIAESPSRSTEWNNNPLEHWAHNQIEAENFTSNKKGEFVTTFKNCRVYKVYYSNITEYALIPNEFKTIMGYVRIVKKNYTFTNGLWNHSFNGRGLVFDFFTNWLLPKYKLIISDIMTTPRGETFWKKIAQWGLTNNKECGMFTEENTTLKTPEQFIPLKNIQDFEGAWNNKGFLKRIYIKD